jgi:hypothetical protein
MGDEGAGSAAFQRKSSSPRPAPSLALSIQFLPQSIIEQWVFARTMDEVSVSDILILNLRQTAMVLEEIMEIYESFDENKKRECGRDVQSVVQQTLVSLKMDSLSVALNGLKLLELISSTHAPEFLSSLDDIFPVLLVSLLPSPFSLSLSLS